MMEGFSALKTGIGIFTLVCSGLLILVIVKLLAFKKSLSAGKPSTFDLTPPEEGYGPIDARWEEIKRHLHSTNESEWKFAVIEADKLTDDILKKIGYPGETMGERMILIKPEQLNTIGYLWEAHKMRNNIVHDPNFKMIHEDAVKALSLYEAVLKELRAINE